MSLRVRAVLALVLVGLFPILVLTGAVAFLSGGMILAAKTTTVLGGKVALLAIPLVWALARAVRDVRRAREADPVPGVELTRAEHPALWAELDDVARRMRQRAVDRVVVLPQVNAFVTEATGRRELMIGLPLLGTLNRGQLRAVLAHELGHFGEGHTRAGARAYRAEVVLRRTHARLEHGLLRKLVELYHRLYLRVSMSVLRDHERQADEWSARLAGGEVSASVFPVVARLDVAWDHLTDAYLPLAAAAPARPSAVEGLHRLLDGRRDELDAVTADRLAVPTSRYDTHPSAQERMARLRSGGAVAELPHGPQPAWSLLGRQQHSLLDIERSLGVVEGEVGSWDEAVRAAVLAEAQTRARLLLNQLVQQVPDAYASAGWALHAVEQGHGAAMIRPLLRGDIPAEHREAAAAGALAQCLDSLILTVLAAQQRATVTVNWSGPWQAWLIEDDGSRSPWPFDDAVAEAAKDPAKAGELTSRLRAMGIDLDAALEADDEPVEVRSAAVAGLATVLPRPRPPGVRIRQGFDVVVFDDGLLMHPAPRWATGPRSVARAQVLHSGSERHAQRLAELAQEVGGEPAKWAAEAGLPTRWIPFTDITSARWRFRLSVRQERLQLELRDGASLAFLIVPMSVRLGDIDAVLDNALGGP